MQERPGELFLHTFFIVTSFSKTELRADELLDYYRVVPRMPVNIVVTASSCRYLHEILKPQQLQCGVRGESRAWSRMLNILGLARDSRLAPYRRCFARFQSEPGPVRYPRRTSRLMIRRWISEVPSPITQSLASRHMRSTGYSRV